jgi:Fic family protein
MELWLPEELDINDTSSALVTDAEETARRVHHLRPLPSAVMRRIQEELLGKRVYSSNAIEGNTLDLRETVIILKTGKISGGRKREQREARNLGEAVDKITAWVDAGDSCHHPERVLEIHATLLREIDDQWAGRYRDKRVMIQGAKQQPPDATLVKPLMERMLERLANPADTSAVITATWAHWAIARMHPFFDGNGRMARLWQDLVLGQGGLTCAIIRPEDRTDYLAALAQADEGDFNPLIQMVAQRVSKSFDKYDAAIREDEDQNRRIAALVGEADSRLEERSKLAFERWSRKMEQLRWEFELCASSITDRSTSIKFQVRKHDLIDQTRWENIRSGVGASRTGFFDVDCWCREKRVRYYLFFGKHYWSDLDTEEERATNRVCLLVSESRAGLAEATRLDQMEECPLTLREVFIVNDSFIRKRVDPATDQLVYNRAVSAQDIALDFLEEVVLRRLT